MKRPTTWYALILIALALLLRGARNVRAESNPSPLPIRTQQQPTAHQIPAAQTLPATVSENPLASRATTSDQKTIQSPEQSTRRRLFGLLWQINWSNWGLVAAAIWAGCIAIRTLSAIKVQSDFATHTLTNLERPWISIPSAQGVWLGADPQGYEIFEIRFEIANSGRSPAMVISTLRATRFTEDIGSLSPQPRYPLPEIGTGRGTIGVSDKNHSDFAVKFRQEDAQKILDGDATLIFFGQILYRAPWETDKDAPHETRFCLFYGPPRRFRVPGTEHPGEFHFAGPEAYNRWT
jgi:hypothetical protein